MVKKQPSMQITVNSVVHFRYTMKNEKEEVLENTLEGPVTSYMQGSSAIHATLQAEMEGLEEGSNKQFTVHKETGLADENLSFYVEIDKVRQASEEEILFGYLQEESGCGDNCGCR